MVIVGCGGSPPKPSTVPVTGTVTYKGQPVEGAAVNFYVDGSPAPSSATTDASGKFALSSFGDKEGAPIGSATVTVTKIQGGAGADPDNPGASASAGEPKNSLPDKYASTMTSPLQFEVKSGDANDFPIDLTD
ncbi:MAG: carboxypeptidase regulatory-like domain-containing protein [Planctomycetales bacterium]|nr:carboxypeptidase regulatory-like domain-containing protein [Planctomycetales bacterium]